MHLNDKLDKLD